MLMNSLKRHILISHWTLKENQANAEIWPVEPVVGEALHPEDHDHIPDESYSVYPLTQPLPTFRQGSCRRQDTFLVFVCCTKYRLTLLVSSLIDRPEFKFHLTT